jgi:hypothetical protein
MDTSRDQILKEAPRLVRSGFERGEVRMAPRLEPLHGLCGRKRRNVWRRNRVRKNNAMGLTERGTKEIYKKWPVLELLHGKVRKAARQQLEREEFRRKGLTVRGTVRIGSWKYPQLAGLSKREYARRYVAMRRKAVKEKLNKPS